MMTPQQYEEMVAAHFRQQGYSVEVTPRSNDYGVDIFASKPTHKLAVQVKMYGNTRRKINREMVMQLDGAEDYFDCTKAVIVTDGEVANDARRVATKLRIEILFFPGSSLSEVAIPTVAPEVPKARSAGAPTFDEIWERL